eukprot:m.20399 g.20399  ORF g.20399 m.20399 type:complete len:344 (-) comp5565_c0_seq2:2785-3816(-)
MVPPVATAVRGLGRALKKLGHWVAQVPLVPPVAGTAAPLQREPPTPRKLDNFSILSRQPLILEARGFISPNECQMVIDSAQIDGRRMMAIEGNGATKYELSQWPLQDCHKASSDSVLSRSRLLDSIYNRIDHVIGISRYSEEVPPKIHHYSEHCEDPSAEDVPGTNSRMPTGLHVDTNAVGTYATAILYLSTLDATSDGATVFPCCHEPDEGRSCRVEQAQSAGAALWQDDAVHTGQASVGGAGAADILLKDAAAGRGLSVYPEAGKLVVFFTRSDDGTVDSTSYHGGARVRPHPTQPQHSGKWMLQLCKEIPLALRGLVGSANFVAARRRDAMSRVGDGEEN